MTENAEGRSAQEWQALFAEAFDPLRDELAASRDSNLQRLGRMLVIGALVGIVFTSAGVGTIAMAVAAKLPDEPPMTAFSSTLAFGSVIIGFFGGVAALYAFLRRSKGHWKRPFEEWVWVGVVRGKLGDVGEGQFGLEEIGETTAISPGGEAKSVRFETQITGDWNFAGGKGLMLRFHGQLAPVSMERPPASDSRTAQERAQDTVAMRNVALVSGHFDGPIGCDVQAAPDALAALRALGKEAEINVLLIAGPEEEFPIRLVRQL